MKAGLLRHAAACRVALAVRPVQPASRASSAALALARFSRSAVALSRPAGSLLRFYSSEAAASQPASDGAPKLISRFEELLQLGVTEQLVRAITEGMRYETMTDVQSLTINSALAGKDVVAQAKTGTGKTLAFLVPIIQKIIAQQPRLAQPPRGHRWARDPPRCDDIRAIVLSPTRELAEQIAEEARRLCKNTGVTVQTAVGGTQKKSMLLRARREGCHLLVATPGRLRDLLDDPTSGIDAPRLAALVLDEADRMLDVGFQDELDAIFHILPTIEQCPRQTLLYSATLPKHVVSLARKFINPTNFEFVQTVKADEVPTHEKVPQFIVPCRGFENLGPTLLEIIRHHTEKADPSTPFKAIVFLPTTASVTYYSHLFRHLRGDEPWMPKIFEMHSRLSQSTRTHNADAFRKATSAILISSDVSARGMDFPNVTHVIQVHVPTTRDTYIHRIGRTGRAGKEGQAYLLVSDIEVPSARYLLPGLPIQRCTDFESGLVDVRRAHRLPDTFEKIREAAKKVPHEVLKETYTSLLLGNMSSVEKQEMVDELNNMAKYTWGMEAPPAVSPKLKRHLGRVRGLRIADEPRFRHSRGRGFRGGFDRDYNDRFENLERMAAEERDGHKPSRVPRASF